MAFTGENEQALRKISDLSRFISIFLLLLHIYFFCYSVFRNWGLASPITDRLLLNGANTGLFKNLERSKIISLAFLLLSLLGIQGKKNSSLSLTKPLVFILLGLG